MSMKMVKHIKTGDIFVDAGVLLQATEKPVMVNGKLFIQAKAVPNGKRSSKREFVNPNRKVRLLKVGDSFTAA